MELLAEAAGCAEGALQGSGCPLYGIIIAVGVGVVNEDFALSLRQQ